MDYFNIEIKEIIDEPKCKLAVIFKTLPSGPDIPMKDIPRQTNVNETRKILRISASIKDADEKKVRFILMNKETKRQLCITDIPLKWFSREITTTEFFPMQWTPFEYEENKRPLLIQLRVERTTSKSIYTHPYQTPIGSLLIVPTWSRPIDSEIEKKKDPFRSTVLMGNVAPEADPYLLGNNDEYVDASSSNHGHILDDDFSMMQDLIPNSVAQPKELENHVQVHYPGPYFS